MVAEATEVIVADAVNGAHLELREVAAVAQCAGCLSNPVAQLKGGLLSERAEHDLLRLGLTVKQDVQRTHHQYQRLARPRASDDQQRAVGVSHGHLLVLVEKRIVFLNRWV